jgi:nucleotide-binding universal stress UspA family protein
MNAEVDALVAKLRAAGYARTSAASLLVVEAGEALLDAANELEALAAAPPVGEADGDRAKHMRDSMPRFSQYQMDEATKPLHAEIERLRAALAPPAPVEIHHGTAETVIGPGPHDGSAWAVPAPSYKE